MQINKITDYFSASPQILPGDIKSIAEKGFKSVMCNRPDGEDTDQPTFKEIETEAKKYGMETAHIPVQGGNISDEDVSDFKNKLEEMPGPILAYCRSGTRSATLWSLAQTKPSMKK